jgi:hypothetical protein
MKMEVEMERKGGSEEERGESTFGARLGVVGCHFEFEAFDVWS